MGGDSHLPDLAWVWPALSQALIALERPSELHLWGCTLPNDLVAAPLVQVIQHPGFTRYGQFAAAFSANAQADIWLAPLQPGLFNRCKSAIKFWEYSAVGGAGVYSDIDPYQAVVQHGENGLLAKSAEDWVAAIIRLANNPEMRINLAANAQRLLQTQGLLSHHLASWQRLFAIHPSLQPASEPDLSLAPAMVRLGEQIQQRSDERHQEVVGFLQRLYEIYESWWWRGWQRAKKIARLDFSPLPHFKPFPLTDEDG